MSKQFYGKKEKNTYSEVHAKKYKCFICAIKKYTKTQQQKNLLTKTFANLEENCNLRLLLEMSTLQ